MCSFPENFPSLCGIGKIKRWHVLFLKINQEKLVG